jgi:outer membrane protein TolC
MKLHNLIITLVAGVLIGALSMLQAQGNKHITLSVDQSVTIGLENSKSLHASLMKRQAADAKSSETNSSRLPKVSFGGSYTRLSEVSPYVLSLSFLPPPYNDYQFTLTPAIFNNYNLKLSLQQPLFTGFKISSGADMAEYNAFATDEDYNKDQAELIYNIKNAYWTLFKAQQMKTVLDENIGQMQSHLKDVQNMLAQGLATNNDVLKIQVQLSNVQLAQLDMANNVQLAMVNLNYLMNQPLDNEIELTSTPESETGAGAGDDLNSLITTALDRRSEIKGMQYRVQASEAGVTFARSGWYPQVYLVGNYYYSRPNQRIMPVEDKFNDTWDASLSVSFDVWNWGQTIDQTQQAQAQLAQAQDGLSQVRDGVAMEVTSAYLSLKKSKESISLAGQGVKQAEENDRITNEKFKAGIASNSDVLDAEVALLQSKTNYTNSLVDFELAQARLQKSLGEQH